MGKADLHFIVVDNNNLNCFVAEKMLRRIDETIQIHIFLLAVEALDYLKSLKEGNGQTKYIILSDIHMPLMNGFQFVEALEQFSESLLNQITIYLLTSSTDINVKRQSDNFASVKRFISKPLTFSILESIIKEAGE